MSYLGVPPFGQTVRTVTEVVATAGQTTFAPSGGYLPGYIDVYLNGVSLSDSDFTASDGVVVVLQAAASAADEFKAVAYWPVSLVDTYRKAESDARYMSIDEEALPDQTGQAGKYLKTDGTDASWETITAPSPAAVSDQANTSTGYFAIPAGTSAQRPTTPTVGMIRYNTTYSEYEIYEGTTWKGITTQVSGTYTVDYLVVAGGGGGGSGFAGGGGAGGYLNSSVSVVSGTTNSIVVGGGGAGGTGGGVGAVGSGSSAFTTSCVGGGYGGGQYNAGGSSGGSGGGGSQTTGGAGTIGQGNNGGTGAQRVGGGGGGKSAVGESPAANTKGGNGGAGAQWLNGTYYAGGGGGASQPGYGYGTGGIGGGGDGSVTTVGNPGTANTGGGGGGGAWNSTPYAGGAGGSGVVIIRYSGGQRGSGGTVTSSDGYTYHTFTTSGTFTA